MFIVYHVKSTMENRDGKRFKFKGHAQNFADRLSLANQEHYAVASMEDYNANVIYMVTRKNLMSGKEYQELSNTPSYCSPAYESYWSM